MGKLANAPLLEVIFEIKWQLKSNNDLMKCQYLHGDFFSKMGKKYPYRESLIPPEVPMDAYLYMPAHRYRTKKDEYPLIQLGPGILTVNTTDNNYFWNKYEKWCQEAYLTLKELYEFDNNEQINLSLKYFDFFPFDFKKNNVIEFLSNNFNLEFNQTFIDENSFPASINIGFEYEVSFGNYSIKINRASNRKKQNGLIFNTTLSKKCHLLDKEQFINWLDESHNYVSKSFKLMIKEKMYNSFK